MTQDPSALRQLPRVDDLLAHAAVVAASENTPHAVAREAVQQAISGTRTAILAGDEADVSADAVAARAVELIRTANTPHLRRAVNAAGIVLHTGLGRAPLSEAAQQRLAEVATGYSNLQADLETAGRMQREEHVLSLLRAITGAEAALVVNNNASATVLVLNALAAGREVILSRGEMIEIGGAFRIPDILELAGCRLVEVGCTNRTHLRDYDAAITDETALLLSVHHSNYRMVGFASHVPIDAMAGLARERGLACAHDLGSGALIELAQYGLPHEPMVQESLAAGADCALFSGDKLIGGPQCGIIVGKADILQRMRKNPYYRAFRVGKLTLAALEGTLRLFLDPERLPETHRVTGMLTCPVETVRARAETLAAKAREACGDAFAIEVADSESQVGGGSISGRALPTVVVRVRSERVGVDEFARRLRLGEPPVFTRIQDDAVLLDARTLLPDEMDLVTAALAAIARETA